jgi:DNA-binding NtrC family response regulator
VAAKILAVDDNEEGLFALEQVLQKHGFNTVVAQSGAEALKKVETEAPDLILLDVNMPGLSGLDVVSQLKQDPWLRYIPVLLLTANDDLDGVVRGLDNGADDYIRKPFVTDELIARVRAAMRTRRLYQELEQSRKDNAQLLRRLGDECSFGKLIGSSQAMREVYALLEKIKDSEVPVLIQGESGTGKELVAAALHFASPRRDKAFVVQNCSAFSDNLLESELFGHVRGAFTGAVRDKMGLFETADGGTFFLDEVGEMSPALQAKLLRVLQEGTFTPVGATKTKKVSVRVLAATHRDLRAMVASGSFREDLFYRLNVVTVQLPPLRDRRSDVPLLCENFLAKIAEPKKLKSKSLDLNALRILADYDWPGNVRELQNEMQRAALMAGENAVITEQDLSQHLRARPESHTRVLSGSLKEAVVQLEREMLGAALAECKGNKSEAAKRLGISRSNVIAKAKEYGLDA